LRLETGVYDVWLAILTTGRDVRLSPTNHASLIDFVVSFRPICHDYLRQKSRQVFTEGRLDKLTRGTLGKYSSGEMSERKGKASVMQGCWRIGKLIYMDESSLRITQPGKHFLVLWAS
jgi:hypothetical protein